MKKLLSILIILLAVGLTCSRAQITFDTAQINPFGLASMAYFSTPALADLDGDGDMDLITGSVPGTYYYFQNTGNSSAPVFAPVIANPYGLGGTIGYSTPAFADLDSDGDFDFMEGDGYFGNFVYYRNNGTATAPAFTYIGNNPFGLTNIGFAALMNPTFSDLDADGDLDFMAGNQYGNFFYFENTGTASAPAFAPVQINPFGLTNIGNSCCSNEASTAFADLDKDGDQDLMSGSWTGNFYYFENTGTAYTPSFAAFHVNPFGLNSPVTNASNSTPAFVDLDADGDMDVMSGEVTGNYYYFQNSSCTGLAVYADVDGDGYGDAANTLFAADCIAPSGYALNNTDCNDGNANVHPDKVEKLNGIDDDCNGIVDDVSCQVPTNLSVSKITGTSAKLKWDAVAEAEGYKVRYKVATADEWQHGVTDHNGKPISGLLPNTNYAWELKSFCEIEPNVVSEWSSEQTFTTGSSRIGEEEVVTMGLYPNPVCENFTIELQLNSSVTQSATIFLLNVLGQIIYSSHAVVNGELKKEITMPSNAASGWYIVRVIMNDQVIEKKFLCEK